MRKKILVGTWRRACGTAAAVAVALACVGATAAGVPGRWDTVAQGVNVPGDYLIPVNADIPDMDVIFVGEPDRATPVGTKGVGEVGLVGLAAAIANAVHHATSLGFFAKAAPIMLSRVTSLASCASLQLSVPVGRIGTTR